MSLRERIFADIPRVFERLDHFAETHYWNGVPIVCVPDEEEAIKRKNNNVNDVSWDNNNRNVLIHVPVDGFPGEPEPNTHIYFDRKPMRILSVDHNMGMYDIMLNAVDTREVI